MENKEKGESEATDPKSQLSMEESSSKLRLLISEGIDPISSK